jgi:hypothetical protein
MVKMYNKTNPFYAQSKGHVWARHVVSHTLVGQNSIHRRREGSIFDLTPLAEMYRPFHLFS